MVLCVSLGGFLLQLNINGDVDMASIEEILVKLGAAFERPAEFPKLIQPTTPNKRTLNEVWNEEERNFKLPSGLLSSMAAQETGVYKDPLTVTNRVGAKGILQHRDIFIEEESKHLKQKLDPFNPVLAGKASANAIARYMKRGLELPEALMAYNMGYDGFIRARDKAPETINWDYANNILKMMKGEGVKTLSKEFKEALNNRRIY